MDDFEKWHSTAILPAAKVQDLSGALYTKEALEWTWQAALASKPVLSEDEAVEIIKTDEMRRTIKNGSNRCLWRE